MTRLVDSHTHLYQSARQARRLKADYVIDEYGEKDDVALSSRDGRVQDLLDSMAENGIERAIVLNLFVSTPGGRWRVERTPGKLDGSPLEHDRTTAKQSLVRYNDWLVEVAIAHPQLVAYASIDPGVLPGEKASNYIRDLAATGHVRGVKLHPNLHEVAPSSPILEPLFRTCEELDYPIVSHCGPAHGQHGGATPSAFAPVLELHPRLTLVLAHLGGGAWTEAAGVAADFSNVYFDCAEILPWIGASRGPTIEDVATLIRAISAERVLLGSDFPWYEQSTHISMILSLPGLGDEEKERILGLNAMRVLLRNA